MTSEWINIFQHNGTDPNATFYNETGFNGTLAPSAEGTGNSEQFMESVGFMSGYLVLVFFFVVPSCILYRRRQEQLNEQYENRHPYLQQLADYGLIMLQQEHRNQEAEETDRQRRSRRLHHALESSTIVLKAEDMIQREDGDGPDIEMQIDESEQQRISIQLGPDLPNGNRQIPSTCAICLCPYEVGEEISVSPNELCIHAFHSECAITWLSKSDEPKCPCCRQDFCDFVEENAPTRESSTVEDIDGSDFYDDDAESTGNTSYVA